MPATSIAMPNRLRQILRALMLCLVYLFLSPAIHAKQKIAVVVYEYLPFFALEEQQSRGVIPDLLRLLNQAQDKVIGLLLQKRADMGLVANSFINRYLYLHPELKSTLLISQSFDQQYQHGALLRRGAKIEIH